MDAIYRAWRFLQDQVLGYVAAIVMLLVTLLANVEIFRRYVEGRTFYWGQDAVTYFLVGAAFMYFGVSQGTRAHLAVTIIPDWLKSSGRVKAATIFRILSGVATLAFITGFVWWGWPAAERTLRMGRLTESMIIPLWPFQFALLAGMIVFGITVFFHLYRDVMAFIGRDVFPWDTDHEDFEI